MPDRGTRSTTDPSRRPADPGRARRQGQTSRSASPKPTSGAKQPQQRTSRSRPPASRNGTGAANRPERSGAGAAPSRAAATRAPARKAPAPKAPAPKAPAPKAPAPKAPASKAPAGTAPAQQAAAQQSAAQQSAARAVSRQRQPPPATGIGRLFTPPDTRGPRVRMGVLWFFLQLAAVTSGRWWTAALWSLVAFFGAAQMVLVWSRPSGSTDPDEGDAPSRGVAEGVDAVPRAGLAGLCAVAIVLAAGYGTGLAGAVLVVVASVGGLAIAVGGPIRTAAAPMVLGTLVCGIAGASVVLATRIDLWAGLFLVLGVSLYDAGSFVFGAEAPSRWEGPVGGVIGVLAVTFTMSTVGVPPFDRTGAWIAGGALALGCVLGQFVMSALLPDPAARVTVLRRVDTYAFAGPAFVACAWLLGG